MSKIERRNLILTSAARLFASRRFDEVLMDDIAREAGVAKGTLYSYFPDKEELYFAVVFEGISSLNEQLHQEAQGQAAPEEALRRMLHSLVAFLWQNRFFFKLMSIEDSKSEGGRGTNRRRWHEERQRQMEAIQAVLRSGAEQGAFDIRHLQTEAHILRDMVRSVLQCREAGLDADGMVDVVMRIFLRGVSRGS
ncbi:MAG: TetR/AcrR family transcriptional regulator [Candidatus Latescibacterota bacterium]